MTTSNWPARLTPFTGGAALALLILGLVVDPAQAGTLECRQCLYTWRWDGPAAAQACAGKTGYELKHCRMELANEKCRTPHPPAPGICADPAPPGGGGYADCASDACSLTHYCGENLTTSCTEYCAGCDSSGANCNPLPVLPPPPSWMPSHCHTYCGCGSIP